jgi:hypothetical protein
VREKDQTTTEARHKLAIRIEFQDRIEIGIGAAVATASVDRPDVSSIGVDIDPCG